MIEDRRLIVGISVGTFIAIVPLLVLVSFFYGAPILRNGIVFWGVGVLIVANLLLLLRQTIRNDFRKRLSIFLLLMAMATAYLLTGEVNFPRLTLALTASLFVMMTLNVMVYFRDQMSRLK